MKNEVNISKESTAFSMNSLPINWQHSMSTFLRISASSAKGKNKKQKVVEKCQRQERRSRSTEDFAGTF